MEPWEKEENKLKKFFSIYGESIPNFFIGEEVDLLNPPHWAPGSERVFITGMWINDDGNLQFSWVGENRSIGGAPATAFRKIKK